MKKKVIAVLIVVVIGAGIYGGSLLDRGFSARDEPSLPEIMAARTARRLATPMRVRKMQNPDSVTPDALAEARINYAQNCALCHGNDGSGDTAIGRNLYPKPPDLRLAATQSQTDGELYAVIQNGIRLTGMPAWGEVRDDDRDRWNLVAFIRHIPSLTPAEISAMERYNPRSPDDVSPEVQEQKKSTGIKPSANGSNQSPRHAR